MYQLPLAYELLTYPEGFTYTPDFLSLHEEHELLSIFKTIEFHPYVYGGYDAKRKIQSYSRQNAFPVFLVPYMERAAAYFDIPFTAIEHVMITEYAPGTQLGWHRDMPPYAKIIGISLGSAIPFRFRRNHGQYWERITLTAEARSIYMMKGPARYEWQHSIPRVEDWRYSITMRTIEM